MDRAKIDEIICPEGSESGFLTVFLRHLKPIEATFTVDIALRGDKIMVQGAPPNRRRFRTYIRHLLDILQEQGKVSDHDFKVSLNMAETGKLDQIKEQISRSDDLRVNGKEVHPQTFNQKAYLRAMRENVLVFGVGPAGTGKTYLAIAMALHFLLSKQVERIVLTRPVVEAGEKLGFLPGDIQQKVNPYFRPLYDALYFLLGVEKTAELIESNTIEIAPLAYMRGRTINNAFIILDEGQNTVNSQMKMFLTRFGQNSRIVVTADLTQIDLDNPTRSGIFHALKILRDIEGIGIVNLTEKDIVRHPLVQRIIHAYEKHSE